MALSCGRATARSAGTVLVKDIRPALAVLTRSISRTSTGRCIFRANDGTNGPELWKSDGTSAGTVLVKDIRPGASGANPLSLTNVNGTLYFRANDGTNGNELWKLAVEAGAVNLAPSNTVPGAQTVNEDTALVISGLSVSDADAGTLNVSVRLSVVSGTLTVSERRRGVTTARSAATAGHR